MTGPTDSVRAALHPWLQGLWAGDLLFFGVLGIAAILLPRRLQVLGLGLEGVARIAMGLGSTVYALAILEAVGWERGRFVVMTYGGIAALLLVGAFQIIRWLIHQRKAVSLVLKATEDNR